MPGASCFMRHGMWPIAVGNFSNWSISTPCADALERNSASAVSRTTTPLNAWTECCATGRGRPAVAMAGIAGAGGGGGGGLLGRGVGLGGGRSK